MERIGLAASKIAKGNLLLYNLCVVLLSLLVALLLFFIAGTAIFLGLLLLRAIFGGMFPSSGEGTWAAIAGVCMVSLTVVVSGVSLFAISKNLRLKK
jgi:hypothetical protein